jgi:hypothetical protein
MASSQSISICIISPSLTESGSSDFAMFKVTVTSPLKSEDPKPHRPGGDAVTALAIQDVLLPQVLAWNSRQSVGHSN